MMTIFRLHSVRFFSDPRFFHFVLRNVVDYKNTIKCGQISASNNTFVRLGTDYKIRNGGYFESIKNSADQFISKP